MNSLTTDFDIGIAGELVAGARESIKQSKKQTFAPADAFERGGRLLKSREVAQDLTDAFFADYSANLANKR